MNDRAIIPSWAISLALRDKRWIPAAKVVTGSDEGTTSSGEGRSLLAGWGWWRAVEDHCGAAE